ncbi:MAG: PAS domain-containing protein [Spirochaetes bacterium]|nr:PAS domain-containing protein [Spirochaetota bacterium]MBU0954275.1 PAS domain-containing protein [Spirochaetota bacterium]
MPAISVISGSSQTCRSTAMQLAFYFGASITVHEYALDIPGLMPPVSDLYLFTSSAAHQEFLASTVLPTNADCLLGSRTLDPGKLERLSVLPAASRILLVNDSANTCREVIQLLQQVGLDDIEWISWYPGCPSPEPSITIAVTAGEPALIPPEILQTIDIGSRLLDSYTLTLISQGLEANPENRRDFELIHLRHLLAYARSLHQHQKERDEYASLLNDTQNYLRGVLEALPTLIIAIAPDGRVYHCNQATVERLGIAKPYLIGSNILDAVPSLAIYIDQANQQADQNHVHLLFSRLQLPPVFEWADLALFSLRSASGQGYVIRIEDISLQVDQEQQLLRMHKMETVGQLAASVVHDYNNYLNAITGSLSMIQLLLDEPTPDRNQVLEYAENINQAAKRIAHFNQQLLQLSKDSPLEYRTLDLNSLCRDCLSLCKSSFPDGVRTTLGCSAGTLCVQADRYQLEEVIVNLLVNAGFSLAHSKKPEDGIALGIQLNTWRLEAGYEGNPLPGAACCIAVTDNGGGIPPEILPRIFEPFFSTKAKDEGSGLGLSIVWKVIERHQGQISVNSEPGKGACFTIYLPETGTNCGCC